MTIKKFGQELTNSNSPKEILIEFARSFQANWPLFENQTNEDILLPAFIARDMMCFFSFPSFYLSKHLKIPQDSDKGYLVDLAVSDLSRSIIVVSVPHSCTAPDFVHVLNAKVYSCYYSKEILDDVKNDGVSSYNFYDVPKCILLNFLSSIGSLIDSRLRAYASILSQHVTFNENQFKKSLCVQGWKLGSLFKIGNGLEIVSATTRFHVVSGRDDKGEFVSEEESSNGLKVVTVPLTFNVEMNVRIPVLPTKVMKVSLRVEGTISGTFREEKLLASQVLVDSRALLNSMMDKARVIAGEVVNCISCLKYPIYPVIHQHIHQLKNNELLIVDDNFERRQSIRTQQKKFPCKRTHAIASSDYCSLDAPSTQYCATLIDFVMGDWDFSKSPNIYKRRKLS
jgi:hypothetical protein